MPKLVAHLIDDDGAIRASVQLLLECEGIETRAYASGDEFLRTAAPGADGCLIIDMDMPGIGGSNSSINFAPMA